MKKIKVAVIFGGKSAENKISHLSAESILKNIDREKFDVIEVEISKTGEFDIDKIIGVDIVFPILHGFGGEDGAIQGFLETLNIPYVGSGIRASALALDKIASKQIWQNENLPIPAFWFFKKSQWQENHDQIISKIKLSAFIKPSNTGSSIGITKVTNNGDIAKAVDEALKYDSRIIVEEAIENFRELEIAVLGNDELIISDPGEVIVQDGFYSFEAKYELETKTEIPARLEKNKIAELKSLAEKSYRALGCCGFSRVDLFLKNDGQILLNEINTLPGFTAISMFPKLMQTSGIEYKDLITKIIELGFKK